MPAQRVKEERKSMSIIETPVQLKHLTLKNRVVRSAVHSFLADEDGRMTEAEYAMYVELAQGGIGTIITGHCCVDPRGRANATQVNIYDDSYAAQFRRAAKIAHAAGAVLIPQISHAGPRAIGHDDLADVVARPLKKGREARALTHEEIKEIEHSFIAAAVRLKTAGCDGVQLHAAHSYLLSRFLDPTFNQRTDAYGGSIADRFRIVEEIVRGIKEACGETFPVFIKINIDTKHEDKAAYHEDMVWILKRCREIGVELVELSGVDFINQPKTATLYYLEEAARQKHAEIDRDLGISEPVPAPEPVRVAPAQTVSQEQPEVKQIAFITWLNREQFEALNQCIKQNHIRVQQLRKGSDGKWQ